MTSCSRAATSPARLFDAEIPCAALIAQPLFQFDGAWRQPGNRSDWLRVRFWIFGRFCRREPYPTSATGVLRAGRSPDEITTLMTVQPVFGATEQVANTRLQRLKDMIDPITAWQDLAGLFRANPSDWQLEDSAAALLEAQRGATDGFMVLGTVVPDSFSDFAAVMTRLNV